MTDTPDTHSAEAKQKLTRLINEGVTIHQEISDLKEGLRDTVKAVAEEHSIPATVLNKAIRTAHKMDLDKQMDEFEELQAVLATVGRYAG
jgi:transposase-like protein